jgi:4-hydroxybenzoate polyprenyltransferase
MLVTDPTGRRPAGGVRALPWSTRAADLVTLLRPVHAAKSLLLVPVALLEIRTWSAGAVLAAGSATLAFVIAAACVYVGNDIVDRARDRLHPTKRHRPIASGRVPVPAGLLCCAALLVPLAVLVATGPLDRYWPLLVYLALNVAYTGFLKHIPLVDVGAVALGFVLRVAQGYVVLGARVPGWLAVAVLSIALLLLVGKRRHELLLAGAAHRPALRGYSIELVDQLLPFTGVLAVVAGLMHLATEAPVGDHRNAAVLLSALFAVFALFRYLQVLLVGGGGGDPVRSVLRDRVLVGACLLWAGSLAVTVALADGRWPA